MHVMNETTMVAPHHQLRTRLPTSATKLPKPKKQKPSDSPPTRVVRLPSKKKLTSRRTNPSGEKKSGRKRVRFIRKQSEPVSDVVLIEKASPEYHADLFLSDKEKASIQFLAKCEGEMFLFEEEEMVEELERTFLTSGKDGISAERKATNCSTLREWSHTEVRGLEDVVSGEFEEERTLAVNMILEYQTYLKDTLGNNAGNTDELLRTFCRRVSRRSREFATMLAEGDAAFVVDQC